MAAARKGEQKKKNRNLGELKGNPILLPDEILTPSLIRKGLMNARVFLFVYQVCPLFVPPALQLYAFYLSFERGMSHMWFTSVDQSFENVRQRRGKIHFVQPTRQTCRTRY